MSFFCELGTRLGLEAVGELQQLGREVVDCIRPVVERAMLGAGISGMIEPGAHAAGDIEAARHAHHADRIQPVGILQHLRFQRFRLDIGGKAVRQDRMRDRCDVEINQEKLFRGALFEDDGALFLTSLESVKTS